MKIRSGNIPTELTYIIAAPLTIEIKWEDCEQESEEIPKITVNPTFISDSTNAGTMATGRNWAKQNWHNQIWDPKTRAYVALKPWKVQEITTKNEPIKNIRVLGLDIRMNGGRAWKCVDEQDRYFDLREDVLLDLMRTVGVKEGGYLAGEYVWAKVAQTMKLVRVGSELHAALIEATVRKEAPMIDKKTLKQWSVYEQKNGKVFWYLGRCKMFEPKEDVSKQNSRYNDTDNPVYAKWATWSEVVKGNDTWQKNNYMRNFRAITMDEPPRAPRLVVSYKERTRDLWLEVTDYWDSTKSQEQNCKTLLEKNVFRSTYNHSKEKANTYELTSRVYTTDRKVVREVGTCERPNIYKSLRKEAEKCLLGGYTDANKVARTEKQHRIVAERERVVEAATLMPFGTITAPDEEMDEGFDFWITEIISKEPAV